MNLDKVTRITVVGPGGTREFEKYDLYPDGVEIALQDDGRTLKIFPRHFSEAENLVRVIDEVQQQWEQQLRRETARSAGEDLNAEPDAW